MRNLLCLWTWRNFSNARFWCLMDRYMTCCLEPYAKSCILFCTCATHIVYGHRQQWRHPSWFSNVYPECGRLGCRAIPSWVPASKLHGMHRFKQNPCECVNVILHWKDRKAVLATSWKTWVLLFLSIHGMRTAEGVIKSRLGKQLFTSSVCIWTSSLPDCVGCFNSQIKYGWAGVQTSCPL